MYIMYEASGFLYWYNWGTFCQTVHLVALHIKYIKTHGSVSCGPRSRRVTPVSILTGRKKTPFSHLRSSGCTSLMKQDDFCCGHALQLQHSTFQICAFPRYATSQIGSVSSFFSSYFSFSCRTLTKTAIKLERHIRLP